jgi:hypothetical protein
MYANFFTKILGENISKISRSPADPDFAKSFVSEITSKVFLRMRWIDNGRDWIEPGARKNVLPQP